MSNLFKDQVAVVTGAASGLGLAIAKKLHREVARVAMVDINPGTQAAKDVGENASIFTCDVTKEDQVGALIAQIADRFGRIDILVNSAGITGKTNIKTHDVELDNFRLVFEVNVIGSFLTSRAVLPYMSSEIMDVSCISPRSPAKKVTRGCWRTRLRRPP